MNIEIYADERVSVVLSDEVGPPGIEAIYLVVEGEPFGKGERLPWGTRAGRFVRQFVEDEAPRRGGWTNRTPEAIRLARQFIGPDARRPAFFDDD
jgi:hypothetical protein